MIVWTRLDIIHQASIHGGCGRELKGCIRVRETYAVCEPVSVLPHAPQIDCGLKCTLTVRASNDRSVKRKSSLPRGHNNNSCIPKAT